MIVCREQKRFLFQEVEEGEETKKYETKDEEKDGRQTKT